MTVKRIIRVEYASTTAQFACEHFSRILSSNMGFGTCPTQINDSVIFFTNSIVATSRLSYCFKINLFRFVCYSVYHCWRIKNSKDNVLILFFGPHFHVVVVVRVSPPAFLSYRCSKFLEKQKIISRQV